MVWLSLVGVALRALRFLGANVLRSPGREIAIALVALSGGFCAGHHQRAPLASTLSATSTAAHVDQVDHVDQVKASTSLDLAPTLKSIRTVSRTFRPDGTRAGVVTRVENDVL